VTPKLRALLEKLAAAHGITLCTIEKGSELLSKLNGPNNHAGLDIEQRVVFIGPTSRFQHVLHEIAHVVTAPPDIDYETVPEDFVLMQLERCWVEEFGLADSRAGAEFLDWQLETVAPLIQPDTMLGDVWDYDEHEAWGAGYRRARELGLVDINNKPTYQLPTWKAELLEEARLAVVDAQGTT
jgi:hypothetical protein